MAGAELPERNGPRPRTNPAMPHQQLDQVAPQELPEALFARCNELPGVVVGRSHVSVPGARAFHLDPAAGGSAEAFMRGTEFAHLHPPDDGSLHLVLTEDHAQAVIEAGWGEFHPLVELGVMPPTTVMIYGPRDEEELEVVWNIVQASYFNARGDQSHRVLGASTDER